MKRVKAACICQTLHTKYKIVSEETQSDGSVMIKIIKQYNTSPVGDYLD